MSAGRDRRWLLVLGGIGLVGASFLGGMQVQKLLGRSTATAAQAGGAGGGFGGGQYGGQGRGGLRGGRPTIGTVSSLSGTTMVVQSSAGTSVTVSLANSPQIMDGSGNAVAAVAITTGSMVAVFGTVNSDGSVAATRVRINPSLGGGAGASGTSGGASGT